MAIVPQLATDTADVNGEAIFLFPDVPVGELWSGTTTIPLAEATATSVVTAGGVLVGSMQGPGLFGPWTVDHSMPLAITSSGLTPDRQYLAVWHADSRAAEFSTYPASITTSVAGSIDVPQPLSVEGTVTVRGNVTAELASSSSIVASGRVTLGATPTALPAFGATNGVMLSAPATNTHPAEIGPQSFASGLVLEPGVLIPPLPVTNSDVIYATGTAPDVLTYLVT